MSTVLIGNAYLMGNLTSQSSGDTNKIITHLFVYGKKPEGHRNYSAQYQKHQKDIGNIQELFPSGEQSCFMKSVNVETNEVMYWENRSIGKDIYGWVRLNEEFHGKEIIKPCCSIDRKNSFWITKQGEVFKKIHDYGLIGVPQRVPFFDSINQPIIDIIETPSRDFAICGYQSLSQMIHQMSNICSYWMKSSNQIIPNEIIVIITHYVGNFNKIFTKWWSNSNWKEMNAFKNIPIVSISKSSRCTLFLDIDGNVYQRDGHDGRKCKRIEPYLIDYFVEHLIYSGRNSICW